MNWWLVAEMAFALFCLGYGFHLAMREAARRAYEAAEREERERRERHGLDH